MVGSPAPFSEIGRRARDLLTRDYNYDQKFSLTIPSSTGMGLTATGIKKDQIFVGDITTQHRSEKTTVDVKVDTYCNVSTKVTYDVKPGTKAVISFNIPDQKSGKLDVHYLHHHAAINSSIGLNPAPLLEVAAAIGSQDIAIGGEIGFDTASSSFTKCDVGVSFSKPDYSASLILYAALPIPIVLFYFSALLSMLSFQSRCNANCRTCISFVVFSFCSRHNYKIHYIQNTGTIHVHIPMPACVHSVIHSNIYSRADKGQTLKASYAHLVNPMTGTEVAAEMIHRQDNYENSFSIGSVHKVDPLTLVKTRFTNNGKVAVLSQREWRPKSLVTVSAEYDTKVSNVAPKLGLSIALKP